MLDHGIVIESKHCHLRPMMEADEENVIGLWNQDYVVGNLYMTKTTPEIYREHFARYRTNPNQWRFVIEDLDGNFVGTTGRTLVSPGVYNTGFFALYPTESFLAIEPLVALNTFWFDRMEAQRIEFTVVSTNEKIKKLHRFLGAEDTGVCSERRGSNGKIVRLEHGVYRREAWNLRRAFYESICS